MHLKIFVDFPHKNYGIFFANKKNILKTSN